MKNGKVINLKIVNSTNKSCETVCRYIIIANLYIGKRENSNKIMDT